MALPTSQLIGGKASPLPAYRKLQRLLLAACIVLGPITFTLYVVSWNDVSRGLITTSAMAGASANLLHLASGFAASIFLPIGYLGMALLGMRHSPWLATISAMLGLLGWLPLAALVGIDDLAYDIALRGSNSQLSALWTFFNGDPMMNAYLLIYAVGHLISTVLLGILLIRTRMIPAWAAWAFIVSSPLTIVAFVNSQHYRSIVAPIVCVLLIPGCLYAAFAMIKNKDEEGNDTDRVELRR
jgi:hypothetical protein